MISEVLAGLRQRRLLAATRHLDGWTLEEMYTRYARALVTEAEHTPELANRLASKAARIEAHLVECRFRRRTARAYAYLARYANGGLHAMFDPEPNPGPRTRGYPDGLLRLTAACQVAIKWRVLPPA